MYLHRDDIEKIREIMSRFPDADSCEILQDSSSGIGSHTTILLNTKINGIDGKFEVVISSVENW